MTTIPAFRPAWKERLKARVAFDGPSGAGKTWTALTWARVLSPDGQIGVIDTEARSALFYSPTKEQPIERLHPWDPPFEFQHVEWPPPYDLNLLARTIERYASEFDVLIIDSLSHFWSGEGGLLDMVDSIAKRSTGGNTWAAWKEGTPALRNLIDVILRAPCHMLVTMRSKTEWIIAERENKSGAVVKEPKRIGMAPEMRGGIEYEFTVVCDLDLAHTTTVAKSRANVIADRTAPAGRTHEVAQAFADWLDSGVELVSAAVAHRWIDAMNTIPDQEDRRAVKAQFVDLFGVPDKVTTDMIQDADRWVEATVSALGPPPAPAPAPPPSDEPAPSAAPPLGEEGVFGSEPFESEAYREAAAFAEAAADKAKARRRGDG